MSGIAVAAVGAAFSIFGGISKRAQMRRAQRRAAADRRRAQAQLTALENSRQAIINPYANAKDLSSLAKDLSGMVSNPYANLGVATKGAEIQMEQTDMALANTLDTLASTGASAGGATALAQAALQSKKGVAASIEQQEAQNEKMKAQGQQQMEQIKMQEAQRVQGIQISEGQRMQQADAMGRQFMFNARERRESDKIGYLRGEKQSAKQMEHSAYMNKASISPLGDLGGAMFSAGLGKAMG